MVGRASTRITPTSLKRSQPTIFACDALAVGELDVDRARGADRCRRAALELGDVRDDMRVREDRAGPVDHEAGALRRAVRAEVRVDGDDAVRAGRVERLRGRTSRRAGADRTGRRASPAPGRPPRPSWSSPRDPAADTTRSAAPAPTAAASAATATATDAAHPSHRSSGPSDRPRPFPRGNRAARARFHVETASSATGTAAAGSESVNVVRPGVLLELDRALHVRRELARDRETEAAARGLRRPRPGRSDRRCARRARAGSRARRRGRRGPPGRRHSPP